MDKYEEALKRAKELYDACNFLTKQQMGIVFPELKESEDERMMREFNDWLCEEIEWRTNDLRDEKDRRTLNMLCYVLTKVKDWLEKQKEQKPHRVAVDTCEAIDKVREFDEQMEKEKKPAEWSEEDERFVRDTIAAVEAFYSEGCGQEELVSWLKSLRPQPHWKPSEEQMDALKDALEVMPEYVKPKCTLEGLYDDLKKLTED